MNNIGILRYYSIILMFFEDLFFVCVLLKQRTCKEKAFTPIKQGEFKKLAFILKNTPVAIVHRGKTLII